MLFQIFLAPIFVFLVLTFPFLSHPLSMGVSLLLITIIISLMMGVFHYSLWISYAAVLILLGGLLVIFIYVSLLASNEVFKKNKLFWIPLTFSFLVALFLCNKNLWTNEILLSFNSYFFKNSSYSNFNWLSDFYSYELASFTLFLMFYLLVTLLVVVYNTKNNHGTLRSMT